MTPTTHTHPTRRPGRRPVPRRSAFTLVELMVVIVILLILMGIGLGVGSGLLSSNQGNTTRTILSNMNAVAAEYQARTNESVPLDWSEPIYPSAGDSDSGSTTLGAEDSEEAIKHHSIEHFVAVTMQVPAIASMYQGFSGSLLTDNDDPDHDHGDGFLEVRDAWGNKLIYACNDSGAAGSGAYGVDHDDSNNADDFLPEHDKPYFASAGADGQWGDHRELLKQQRGEGHDIDDADAAADNIYSFELTD